MKKINKFIFHKVLGWKIKGDYTQTHKKCLYIVAPHTSWHDFYVGLFLRRAAKLDVNFVAKKELFIFPFGYYFKWLGGAPLDRSGGLNKVDAIVNEFNKHQTFRLAMAPEGTRKKVEKFRTGFYYIALKANVPVIPVTFDWKTKTVDFGIPIQLTGNIADDEPKIMQHFKGAVGKIPEYTMDL